MIEAGAMQSDSRGKTDTGIYFAMSVNTAPYDTGWNLLYAPEKADCIKLIRSGETKSVANTAAGTIVKFSATEYYLKTEAWTIGDVWPLAEGDILEIEGNFVNADHDVTIHISKSYIQIKNGQALFSTEMPTEEPKEVIQAGNMQQDPRGKTANGLYFTMKTNKAPFATDWSLLYAPVGEESIKLIRNGETSNIAIPGRGTIVKYSDTEYYLKTEAWTMGELMPLVDGDILVIEGQFANGETVMEISKSYVSISNGVAKISTEYPSGGETEIIEAGVMQKDPERTSLSVDLENGSCGLYFTMPENAIPMNETDPWANRFRPVSADSVKLIRNGATLNIGNPEVGEIVKFGAANYYLALDKWAHSEIFPITTNDILLIEGNFTDGTTVFHISKSYVSFSHGLVCITQDYPKGDESGATVVNVSNLTSDARGRTDTGIYFDAKANAAPYDTGWNTSYAPVSTGCVKLIRNGSTTDVAIPGRGTIVKFSSTEYYLKTETWTMGAMMPIVEGDILVIEGEFADGASGTIINISKTYIGIWYGMPFFSTTYPTGPSLSRVYAGMMKNDTREMTATGVYFDMDKNAAPYKTDWTLLYSPVYSSAVQLIRDGKTMSVGIPNRGAIVKFSDTEYYLKTEVWSLGGMMPLQDGDILVVGGQFINAEAGTILNIDKTYIFIQNGKAVIAKPMESIEVANDESKILKLEGLPTGAKVEWTSENEKRVTVDENGKITAHMNRGKVRIFATYENASYFWTVQLFERTPYGNVYLSSSDEEMPVGVWCGSYHEFDETHMLQLEEAGVNLIIGVDEQWVGGGGMFALLNRARDHGISVIVNLRDWDGKTVPNYAKHPALKGFLMWDEPSATDFEKLAETKKKFDELMPENLIFFVNLFPQTSSYEHLFGEGYSPKAVDYENNYIDLFVDEVDPEQLSVDYYPLMKQDGNENLLVKPSYFENLDTLANKAKEEKLPFDWTILAAGHKAGDGTYVTPTEEQLRWQMAVALAYGASSITHYIYASHEEDYEPMIEWETYKPTDVYTRVKTVNQELKTWNDIYMSYSWLGTSKVDVGDKNLMLERLDYDVPVSKYGCLSEVASDKDLLVGAFENAEHQYAYMITNAGDAKKLNDIDYLAEFAMESASVTLHFKPGEYQCVAVVVDGEISFMPVDEDNSITLDIGAYDGAFVMPMVEGNVAMYAVKTGDSMHMYAVISAFVLSAAGIAGVVFAARNKRHQ